MTPASQDPQIDIHEKWIETLHLFIKLLTCLERKQSNGAVIQNLRQYVLDLDHISKMLLSENEDDRFRNSALIISQLQNGPEWIKGKKTSLIEASKENDKSLLEGYIKSMTDNQKATSTLIKELQLLHIELIK